MAIHLDPHIEDSSYLHFEFKKSNGGLFYRTLNFLENIEIKESVDNNYTEYNPIGSNGSVFAYMGSKSRALSLSFNLTLDNIKEHTLVKPTSKEFIDKDSLKSRYFENENLKQEGSISKQWGSAISRFDLRWWQSLSKGEQDIFSKFYPDKTSLIKASTTDLFSKNINSSLGSREQAIFQVMYWLNLIRSSVLTNSQKPYLGPPIITLTHGIMYMSIPCICQSYKVSHDELAGYDQTTYLPRRLKVNMELKEVRLRGKDFAPGGPTSRNIAGWDALFDEEGKSKYITMDPFDQQDDIISLD
jgi:hypothetical protein